MVRSHTLLFSHLLCVVSLTLLPPTAARAGPSRPRATSRASGSCQQPARLAVGQQIVDCDGSCSQVGDPPRVICDAGCQGGWPWAAMFGVMNIGGLRPETAYPYTVRCGCVCFFHLLLLLSLACRLWTVRASSLHPRLPSRSPTTPACRRTRRRLPRLWLRTVIAERRQAAVLPQRVHSQPFVACVCGIADSLLVAFWIRSPASNSWTHRVDCGL